MSNQSSSVAPDTETQSPPYTPTSPDAEEEFYAPTSPGYSAPPPPPAARECGEVHQAEVVQGKEASAQANLTFGSSENGPRDREFDSRGRGKRTNQNSTLRD